MIFLETEGSVGHPSDNQMYGCRAQEKGLATKKDADTLVHWQSYRY